MSHAKNWTNLSKFCPSMIDTGWTESKKRKKFCQSLDRFFSVCPMIDTGLKVQLSSTVHTCEYVEYVLDNVRWPFPKTPTHLLFTLFHSRAFGSKSNDAHESDKKHSRYEDNDDNKERHKESKGEKRHIVIGLKEEKVKGDMTPVEMGNHRIMRSD